MTHLRKAMLEELQRRNLSAITARIYIRAVELLRCDKRPSKVSHFDVHRAPAKPVSLACSPTFFFGI